MDLDVIAKVLEHGVRSLELDGLLHPSELNGIGPRRPVRRSRLLASPCPSTGHWVEMGGEVALEPRVVDAFLPEDRERIARQIDDGYQHLIVLSDEIQEPVDEASVVHVQLGLPLIGRDRVLLRVLTRNVYETQGGGGTITGDFHAWLDPAGTLPKILSQSQNDLAFLWPRWLVGRSPGLRIGVNTATEAELVNLPGSDGPTARAILAGRPFTGPDHMAQVIGADSLRRIRSFIDI